MKTYTHSDVIDEEILHVITLATLKHKTVYLYTVVTDGLVHSDVQLDRDTNREAPNWASNHDGFLPDIVLNL